MWISKRVFQKNKAKFSEKRTFLRNVRFSGNWACFFYLKHPFWDSPLCLITDELKDAVEFTYGSTKISFMKKYKSLQLLLLITMFSSKVQLVLFGPKKEKNCSTNFLSCLFQSIHFLPCSILVPYNSRPKLINKFRYNQKSNSSLQPS